ncbi:MAG: hypothetical protein AAFX85_16275, partial [Pseudomonadota bacterium]
MTAQWLTQILRHPRIAVGVCFVLALLLSAGLDGLTIDDDLQVYFSEQDPKLLELEDFEQTYTREDNVGFVLVPAEGDVFTPEALVQLRDLSEQAWQLPYSQRVVSLSTYQYSEADGDTLLVGPLVPTRGPVSAQTAERARRIVLSSPETRARYANDTAAATTVFVRLALPEATSEAYREVVLAAREIREAFERDHPGVRVLLL